MLRDTLKESGQSNLNLLSPAGVSRMKNRLKAKIRPADYPLECCIEARFWKLAITGRNNGNLSPWIFQAEPMRDSMTSITI
jgi:hypothetical protein